MYGNRFVNILKPSFITSGMARRSTQRRQARATRMAASERRIDRPHWKYEHFK